MTNSSTRWTGQTGVTSSQAVVTNSQAAHESWLLRCFPHAPGFSRKKSAIQLLLLQFSYYFCNLVNIFAIQLLFLQFSYYFCNLIIIFAIQLLFLQFSYSFCNLVIIFAIQLLFLISNKFCISRPPCYICLFVFPSIKTFILCT